MKRTTVVLAGVVSALVLAGCADETVTPTTNPPAVEPGAVASDASTPAAEITKERAGQQYLTLVQPYNDAADRVADAVNAESPNLEEVRSGADETANANRTFGIALQDAAWPADVQSTVDDLVAAVAQEQVAWRELARAETEAQVRSALNQLRNTPSSGISELLRQKLGLPEFQGD